MPLSLRVSPSLIVSSNLTMSTEKRKKIHNLSARETHKIHEKSDDTLKDEHETDGVFRVFRVFRGQKIGA
jgi:hypothetical protein